MTARVTEGARRERHGLSPSFLRRSTLARACTPLTKSEEKETARSLPLAKKVMGHLMEGWGGGH